MKSADLPRLTAAAMLAATGLILAGWLGGMAAAAGWPGLAGLLAVLAPLALGLRGVMSRRRFTGRWLSLLLPFYGAGFLVAAAGNAANRGWATAGAFCAALGFAAIISWLRRPGLPAPPRSPT